jgi:hypothetical protein
MGFLSFRCHLCEREFSFTEVSVKTKSFILPLRSLLNPFSFKTNRLVCIECIELFEKAGYPITGNDSLDQACNVKNRVLQSSSEKQILAQQQKMPTHIQFSPPPPPNIYYLKDGQVLGPESADELRHMIQRGELPPSTKVCKVGSEHWVIFTSLINDVVEKSESIQQREIQEITEGREKVLLTKNNHNLSTSKDRSTSVEYLQENGIEGEESNNTRKKTGTSSNITRESKSAEQNNKGWKYIPLWQKILIVLSVLYVIGLILQAFEHKSSNPNSNSRCTQNNENPCWRRCMAPYRSYSEARAMFSSCCSQCNGRYLPKGTSGSSLFPTCEVCE